MRTLTETDNTITDLERVDTRVDTCDMLTDYNSDSGASVCPPASLVRTPGPLKGGRGQPSFNLAPGVFIRSGFLVRVGFGGGAGGLWAMGIGSDRITKGGSDIYLGADVGKWGTEGAGITSKRDC